MLVWLFSSEVDILFDLSEYAFAYFSVATIPMLHWVCPMFQCFYFPSYKCGSDV